MASEGVRVARHPHDGGIAFAWIDEKRLKLEVAEAKPISGLLE